MTHHAPNPAPCDFGAFVQRVGGDTALARELAQLFIPEARVLLETLRVAVAASAARQIREAAHALRGSAANFDATATIAAASELEAMGKSGELEGADAAFVRLEAECRRLMDALAATAESATRAS